MVIDTSALIAILRNEPEAAAFRAVIVKDPVRLISAGTLLEATMVIEGRRGDDAGNDLDLLLYRAGFIVSPVTHDQVEVARRAFRRYGKGRHPQACLNFGDCFSYALSHTSGEPLLFKGGDFTHTDVRSVSWS